MASKNRSYQREQALKTLYAMEISQRNDLQIALNYLQQNGIDEESMSFYLDLLKIVLDHREEVYVSIAHHKDAYPLNRMSTIDRLIILLAICEMRYLNAAVEVAINEAVELSKKYSDAESYKFVNSLLGAIVRGGND